MSPEKVVIGVVPRDRFSVFPRCLKALYSNTDVPFRVIIVAGGADIRTRQYLQGLQEHEDNCTVVLFDRLLLQGEARNLALQQVREQFFVVLENDTIVHKNWLRPLLDCMRAEKATVVAPLMLEDGRVHAAGGKFEEQMKDGSIEFENQMIFAGMERSIVPLHPTRIDYPETHCMLIDRHLLPADDIFEDVEPFDADLGLTLRKRELTIMLEPRSVATYAPPPALEVCDIAAFKFRWDADAWAERNRRFMQKWNLAYDGAQKELFYRKQVRRLGLARWFPNKCTVLMSNSYNRLLNWVRPYVFAFKRRVHFCLPSAGRRRPAA